jgi:hypothetical protein
MTVNMVIRRTGNYNDAQLKRLRKEGTVILKKHGAVSHRFRSHTRRSGTPPRRSAPAIAGVRLEPRAQTATSGGRHPRIAP